MMTYKLDAFRKIVLAQRHISTVVSIGDGPVERQVKLFYCK